MNPNVICAQLAGLAAVEIVLVILDQSIWAAFIVAIMTVFYLTLLHSYQRALSTRFTAQQRAPRRTSDSQIGLAVLLSAGLVLAALVVRHQLLTDWLVTDLGLISLVFKVLSITLLAVVLSSLTDYLWVVPRVDGLVRAPVWESPEDDSWRTVTRVWLVHRLLAFATFVMGIPIVLLVAIHSQHEEILRNLVLGVCVPLAVTGARSIPKEAIRAAVSAINIPIGSVLQLNNQQLFVWQISLEGARCLDIPSSDDRMPKVTRVLSWQDLLQTTRIDPDDDARRLIARAFEDHGSSFDASSATSSIRTPDRGSERESNATLALPLERPVDPSVRSRGRRSLGIVAVAASLGAAASVGVFLGEVSNESPEWRALAAAVTIATLIFIYSFGQNRQQASHDNSEVSPTSMVGFSSGLQSVANGLSFQRRELLRILGASHD